MIRIILKLMRNELSLEFLPFSQGMHNNISGMALYNITFVHYALFLLNDWNHSSVYQTNIH